MSSYHTQIWAVLAFTKWLHPYKEITSYESSDLTKSAAKLCGSLVADRDSKISARDANNVPPDFSNLVRKVKAELQLAMLVVSSAGLKEDSKLWRLQQAVVVALQVLLPPLRGKTYWDLQLLPSKHSSMSH